MVVAEMSRTCSSLSVLGGLSGLSNNKEGTRYQISNFDYQGKSKTRLIAWFALRARLLINDRLLYDLGQRQGDCLKLIRGAYNGSKINLRQSKTGSEVNVPVLPELKLLLDTVPNKNSIQLVINEYTGRPYTSDNFKSVFRVIANKAGFKGKEFLDLRRSAAVRLAEAGCTPKQVVAVTGHKIEHGQKILDTYMPRTDKMADDAMSKLLKNRHKT
jgi:integrase